MRFSCWRFFFVCVTLFAVPGVDLGLPSAPKQQDWRDAVGVHRGQYRGRLHLLLRQDQGLLCDVSMLCATQITCARSFISDSSSLVFKFRLRLILLQQNQSQMVYNRMRSSALRAVARIFRAHLDYCPPPSVIISA